VSVLRLAGTTAAMSLVAVALAALTPEVSVMAVAMADAQRTADTAGLDALVSSAAGLLAWAVWSWGVVGLALTAATALPGLLGGGARALVQAVLPAGARRSAALALGLGLSVAGPVLGTAAGLVAPPAAAAGSPGVTAAADPVVPDWPAAPASSGAASLSGATVPDWPTVTGAHVVVPGECLWHIAAGRLLDQLGRPPDHGEVAAAVQAWWSANADVIGPDPDLLLPGQVLLPPERP
jgi:hypothetical protein